MPRDVSSSEDTTEPEQNDSIGLKYECPADFTPASYKPCSSTLVEHLRKRRTELWLIKAPVDFDPECVKDVKLNLSGLQSVTVPGKTSSRQMFNIMASPRCSPDLHLLTGSEASAQMLVAPAFSGLLNISQCFEGGDANNLPPALPAAPAPTIPPGLKQRFIPFGSETPRLVRNEVDGLEETDADDEEGRKKKKKKKKKMKTEPVEEEVLKEPAHKMESDKITEFLSGETKKKRKKKDRERQEEVEVKQESDAEPTDSISMDLEEVHVKKKKKKKNKSD